MVTKMKFSNKTKKQEKLGSCQLSREAGVRFGNVFKILKGSDRGNQVKLGWKLYGSYKYIKIKLLKGFAPVSFWTMSDIFLSYCT